MSAIVLRNPRRAGLDQDAFARMAAVMEAAALAQPGYLPFKHHAAADGEVLPVSEWTDEASARAWGRDAEHVTAQRRGRAEWYAQYTLYGCADPRTHRFSAPATGPDDL